MSRGRGLSMVAAVGALHLRDLATGGTTTVTVPGAGAVFSPVLSADGDRVAFVAGDYSLVLHGYVGQLDVFLHDRTSGETTRPIDDGMFNLLPTISADGRVVAASNYGTVIVADVAAGETTRHDVSNETWYDTPVSLSPDGATIAYSPEPAAAVGSGVHLLDVSSGAVTPVPGLAAAYASATLPTASTFWSRRRSTTGTTPRSAACSATTSPAVASMTSARPRVGPSWPATALAGSTARRWASTARTPRATTS